jgi:hypothetical protein
MTNDSLFQAVDGPFRTGLHPFQIKNEKRKGKNGILA